MHSDIKLFISFLFNSLLADLRKPENLSPSYYFEKLRLLREENKPLKEALRLLEEMKQFNVNRNPKIYELLMSLAGKERSLLFVAFFHIVVESFKFEEFIFWSCVDKRTRQKFCLFHLFLLSCYEKYNTFLHFCVVLLCCVTYKHLL